jgi:hypothetical protein
MVQGEFKEGRLSGGTGPEESRYEIVCVLRIVNRGACN